MSVCNEKVGFGSCCPSVCLSVYQSQKSIFHTKLNAVSAKRDMSSVLMRTVPPDDPTRPSDDDDDNSD